LRAPRPAPRWPKAGLGRPPPPLAAGGPAPAHNNHNALTPMPSTAAWPAAARHPHSKPQKPQNRHEIDEAALQVAQSSSVTLVMIPNKHALERQPTTELTHSSPKQRSLQESLKKNIYFFLKHKDKNKNKIKKIYFF